MQVGVGMIDVADSLAAIKKCVFEDKKINKRGLLEALALNFEGRDDVRKMLLGAPKYGNDDDYVDTIAAETYAWWRRMVSEIDVPTGEAHPCPYSVPPTVLPGRGSGHFLVAVTTTAVADGSVHLAQVWILRDPPR
jgi:formate C-acetyltransferase